MKKLLLLFGALLVIANVGAQTTYWGSVSVMVGSAYGPYVNDSVQYLITQNEDATLDVTICEYSLQATVMGNLTLGQYTVLGIAYDEARGSYYRDYTNDGLTMHFMAVSGEQTVMDNEYGFEKRGGNIELTAEGSGYVVTNSFQPGVMPFRIVATATVTPETEGIETILTDAATDASAHDLQGRRVNTPRGFAVEQGRVVYRQ